MGNDLDCTEKKEIDTFFRNNYDQVLKTSRSIKEFAENYQDKTIKGIKYCTTQRNDYPSYYNQKLLHYTKNFDKDNKEREMKESAEREEMLRSEVSYLRSSVNSYSSRLQQIENQKMEERRERERKREEFRRKEEEIKNEYFSSLENEDFQDKECIDVIKDYLKLKVERKEEDFKEKSKEDEEGEDKEDKEDKERLREITKKEEILEILKKLSETENFGDKVKDVVIACVKEILEDKTKKVTHLNILLIGKTGSGKTTLINKVLELENTEKELKTGNKRPVTMVTEYINSDKIDYLRCGDSRGIEVGEFGIKSVQKEAEKFIDQQLKTNNPDFYIHCIWYCTIPITDRFQDDECKLLENLGKKYSMKELPIIIVGTKANSRQSFMSLKKNIEDNVYNFNYPFVPVIAKKIDEKEAMGLEELKELSITKAKDAVESACYQGVYKKLEETVKKKIKKVGMAMKEKAGEKAKEIIEKIEREGQFESLKDDLKEMFTYILDIYLSLKLDNQDDGEYIVNKNTYSLEGEKMITDLIDDYIEYCEENVKKCYSTIYLEKADTLAKRIFKEQVCFNMINRNTIEMKNEEIILEEVKPKIDQILKNRANFYYLKNTFDVFLLFLQQLINCGFDVFFGEYLEKMEKENAEMKEMIVRNIRGQFEELEEKIRRLNDEMKEKKKKEFEEKKKRLIERIKSNGEINDEEMSELMNQI